MQYHTQLYLHQPEQGMYGDCYRTAYACLLDLNPGDVPHWGLPKYEEIWRKSRNEWLAERGYIIIEFAIQAEELRSALVYMAHWNYHILYILSGISANRVPHVVIAQGGQIIHDPSQDQSGIISPLENGCFEIEIIVRKDPAVVQMS